MAIRKNAVSRQVNGKYLRPAAADVQRCPKFPGTSGRQRKPRLFGDVLQEYEERRRCGVLFGSGWRTVRMDIRGAFRHRRANV